MEKEIKLFAFDLDGTLYLKNKVRKDVLELIKYLQGKYQVVFHTNGSVKTSLEVWEKLNDMGFECKENEVYTSSSLTAMYLYENDINNVYVIGSDSFKNEIEKNGIVIVDHWSADNVVVGMTSQFNYDHVANALHIIEKGGKFITCNEDGKYPISSKSSLPGCGALVGSIVYASSKRPDHIVGKPNSYLLEKICQDFSVTNKQIVVIGDSWKSDIDMANDFGCHSILVKEFNTSKQVMEFEKEMMNE